MVLAHSSLSLIVDQRCCDDHTEYTKHQRDTTLDVALEVLHLAWWELHHVVTDVKATTKSGNVRSRAESDGCSSSFAAAATKSDSPQLSIAVHALSHKGVTTVLQPSIMDHQLGPIRNAFADAFKEPLTTAAASEWSPEMIAVPQLQSIGFALDQVIKGNQAHTTTTAMTTEEDDDDGDAGERSVKRQQQQQRAPSSVVVVLVTTLFHAESFSARAAQFIPSLVSSSSSYSINVHVVFTDVGSGKPQSLLRISPILAVHKLPLAPPGTLLRSIVQNILVECWCAPCEVLLPSSVDVVLHAGSHQVRCHATCAVLSALPRCTIDGAIMGSPVVVRGGNIMHSLYEQPRRRRHQNQQLLPSVAAGSDADDISVHLMVESCVPTSAVSESWFIGEAWHLVPVPSSAWDGGADVWSSMFHTCNNAHGAVLRLSSSSALMSPQCSLSLQTTHFVGIFSEDGGNSLLLRCLAPSELRRAVPFSQQQQNAARLMNGLRAPPVQLLDDIRSALLHNASTSHSPLTATSSTFGGAVAVLGCIAAEDPRFTLVLQQNRSHGHHNNSNRSLPQQQQQGFSSSLSMQARAAGGQNAKSSGRWQVRPQQQLHASLYQEQ